MKNLKKFEKFELDNLNNEENTKYKSDLTEFQKNEIREMIEDIGGPHSTIEDILIKTNPLKLKEDSVISYTLDSLNYIASIRKVDNEVINEMVNLYGLSYNNGKFYLK
jgi:hypothetical protein